MSEFTCVDCGERVAWDRVAGEMLTDGRCDHELQAAIVEVFGEEELVRVLADIRALPDE